MDDLDQSSEVSVAMPRRSTLVLPILLIVSALRSPALGQNDASAVSEAIARGDRLVEQRQFQEALGAYRQADALSNHTSADCYLRLAGIERDFGDFSAALEDAKRAAIAAGDDRNLASTALVTRASLLVAMANGPADPKFREAEGQYRQALLVDPKRSIAHFNLGVLLLVEGRDADGIAELKAYIVGPLANPRYVDRARRLIADPTRARVPSSENFSFMTLEGETVSKASLSGKVVLLDFLGTWCPPCRDSVPILVDLHRKYAGRPFQIVGISSDNDEQEWKSFIASHGMNWPEYIDLDGQILSLFEIDAFPTYIVLDRGGAIKFRQSGLGSDTPAVLEDAINNALQTPYAGPTGPSPSSVPAGAAIKTPAPSPVPGGVALSSDNVESVQPLSDSDFVFPPSDIENGDVDANTYRNDFFGLAYKFPQSWPSASPEMLAQLNERQLQSMKQAGARPEPGPYAFPETIFEATPNPRDRLPSVRIAVERCTALTIDTVRREASALKLRPGVNVEEPPQLFTIGKRQFFRTRFEVVQSDQSVFTLSIQTLAAQRYRVTLEIRARSQHELDELAATAQSLSFSKP